MKQYQRSERLQGQILRDVATLLDHRMGEIAGGLVTFTRAKVSNDLRYVTVYYSFLGSEENKGRVESFLERERGWIRSQVSHGLQLRHAPEFSFKFDPSIEEGIRMEKLFEQIKNERNQ
jgi:ribosome-binding factor A